MSSKRSVSSPGAAPSRCARGVAHERAHDPHGTAGNALDDVGALTQQPVDGRSDGAVSEQADAERFAGHGAG